MVTMSQKEFQRVKVIENAVGGRLSVREASRLLQLSERQVQRLKRRYQPDSLDGVQHGNRGQRMPWAVSLPQKQLILRLIRGKYQGFNDSHLAEKLRSAIIVWPSRLRSRNGRVVSSTGWHATRLSRRPAAAHRSAATQQNKSTVARRS
jgi:transposase